MIKEKEIIEYEDAPSGAIKLYNYKEPFMPVPVGCFGYMGVLMHDAEQDLIQCHVCGEWFSKLANHIQKHGFHNTSQYKTEFGLSQSTALVADGLREVMIRNGKINGHLNKASIRKAQATEGSGIKKGYKATLEVRNKRGTCPLQLLDKLDKISKEIGHNPTHAELCKLKTLEGNYFSGRGLSRSLFFVYGSWENAIKQLHWTGLDRKHNRKWTKESLKQLLKEFIISHKRFPTASDTRRRIFPELSGFKTYGGFKKMKEELLTEMIVKYEN